MPGCLQKRRRRYYAIVEVPRTADRLVTMTIAEQSHRHRWEMRALWNDMFMESGALPLGWALAGGCAVGAFILGLAGHTVEMGIMLGVPGRQMVKTIVSGKRPKDSRDTSTVDKRQLNGRHPGKRNRRQSVFNVASFSCRCAIIAACAMQPGACQQPTLSRGSVYDLAMSRALGRLIARGDGRLRGRAKRQAIAKRSRLARQFCHRAQLGGRIRAGYELRRQRYGGHTTCLAQQREHGKCKTWGHGRGVLCGDGLLDRGVFPGAAPAIERPHAPPVFGRIGGEQKVNPR
jgi:hypothetical protein